MGAGAGIAVGGVGGSGVAVAVGAGVGVLVSTGVVVGGTVAVAFPPVWGKCPGTWAVAVARLVCATG